MNKFTFLLFFLLLLFSSCKKNINLEVPSPPAKLAVYANWQKDEPLTVYVSHSINIQAQPFIPPIFYPSNPRYEHLRRYYSVPNAEVMVYRDGILYDQLVYDAQAFLYKSVSGKLAAAGGTYKVVVTAPGYSAVESAAAAFPDEVTINSIELRREVALGEFEGSHNLDELVVELTDNVATKDWYRIKLLPSGNTNHFGNIDVYPLDADIVIPPTSEIIDGKPTVLGDEIIFSDALFNGQTKRVTLRFSSYTFRTSTNEIEGTVVLEKITEDMFKYIRSRILNKEGAFTTPVPRYTNITNGLGIFGLYNSDSEELK